MLVYQAIVMLLVVGVVFILAFVIRMKHRSILALIIVVLVVGGSLLLSVIQSYFGVYFKNQNCNVAYYQKIRLTAYQKDNMGAVLKGFQDVTNTQDQYRSAFEKKYEVNKDGVYSSIKVTYVRYRKKSDADEYFRVRQLFYENKLLLPKYQEKSKVGKKDAPLDFQYITTYIRSNYENYNDAMYVPSRLYYLSEVVIQDGDMIIDLYERTNKPVTEKNAVMEQIAAMLKETANSR